MKKIYSTISLVIGTIIGAGFCSGKEIALYFAKFGFGSLFFVPILFLVIFFIIKLFMLVGKKLEDISFYNLNKKIFKRLSGLVLFIFALIYLIISATMFAGIAEIGNMIFFEVEKGLFLFFSFGMVFIVLLKEFEILKKINSFLVPLIVVLILFCCLKSIFYFKSASFVNFDLMIEKPILIFFNPIIYICQNLIVAYYVLIKAGKDLSIKQINKTAFYSSLILSVLVGVGIIALNLHPEVLNAPMPFVLLAFKIGFPFDLIFLFTIFISIITTLFATTRYLFEITKEKIENKKLNAFFVCALCFLVSLLGFDKIIVYFYPIIGIVGLVLIVLFFIEFFFKKTNSKIHNSCKNTKNESAGHNQI